MMMDTVHFMDEFQEENIALIFDCNVVFKLWNFLCKVNGFTNIRLRLQIIT